MDHEPAGETRAPGERRNYWLLPVLAAGALTALLCCAGTVALVVP